MAKRQITGDLPSPVMHFSNLTRRAPGRVCVAVSSLTYTRNQILEAADALAAGLHALGVGHGDRVAIVRRNSPMHLAALLAASRLGAILVPLNFRLSPAEFQQIFDDAGCAAVLCDPHFAEIFEEHRMTLGPNVLWIVDDIDPSAEQASNPTLSFRWLRLSEVYQAGEGAVPDAVPIYNDMLAILLYTSGSTGKPKGVKLTYGNLYTSWNAFASVLHLSSREVALAVAPFGHVSGLNTFTFATLLSGGTVVLQRRWDVGDALEKIEHFRVTRTFGVPTMYDAMARHPHFYERDLSSLKTAIVGGSPCPEELIELFHARGVPLANSWGMTELAGGGTLTPPHDMKTRSATIGRAIPGLSMQVMSKDGTPLPPGQVGELWVKGPCVTSGYWGTESTPELGFMPGGWLRTGDLVKADDDGYFTIQGRLKDLIISGGENIFPAEIENVIHKHPNIEQCVVVGAPDTRWAEIPVAFVTGTDVNAAQIREFALEHLPKYKVPRNIWVLEKMPLGPTGKPNRKILAELAPGMHNPGPEWYESRPQQF